jgi:hypothetical protein
VLDLVIYGRPGCHLCDEMADELSDHLGRRLYRLRVENVDQRAEWKELYGSRVPVLVTAAGEEVCHFHLDTSALDRLTG